MEDMADEVNLADLEQEVNMAVEVNMPDLEQEVEFGQELVDDLEGCILDFFLGCVKNKSSADIDIVNGKLYGQDYNKIKVFQRLPVKFFSAKTF